MIHQRNHEILALGGLIGSFDAQRSRIIDLDPKKEKEQMSTEQMVASLGWDTLTRRRENHIVKLVENCLKGTAPSYFSKYFQLRKDMIFVIMILGISTN